MLLALIQTDPMFVIVMNPYFMEMDLIVIITIHVILNHVINFQFVLSTMKILMGSAVRAITSMVR